MRIRMTVEIQGFAVGPDGRQMSWPLRGGEVEVDDRTAIKLIHQGYAIPVMSSGPEADTTLPSSDVEERVAGTTARIMARPRPQPTASYAQAGDVAAPIMDSAGEERSAPEVDVHENVEQEEDEVPVKRGPGRPRKYPRPGE